MTTKTASHKLLKGIMHSDEKEDKHNDKNIGKNKS